MLVNYSKYFSSGMREFVCGFGKLDIFCSLINRHIYSLDYFISFSKLLNSLRSKEDVRFNPPEAKGQYFYTTGFT